MVSIDKAMAVLKPFFFSPSRSKYIREIAGKCDLSYERVHSALEEMEKAGVLKSAKKGKIKEYTLNKENELVLKVFSLLEMQRRADFYKKYLFFDGALRNLVSEIFSANYLKKKLFANMASNVLCIVLFGSTARGDQLANDVDVLIVLRTQDKTFENGMQILTNKMNAITGKQFSFHVVSISQLEKNWKKEPFYATLWRDRVVLYGDESFWKEALEMGEPI